MTLDNAKLKLLDAYQALEHAQQQTQAIQAHLRQCELMKVQAEALVQALTPEKEP